MRWIKKDDGYVYSHTRMDHCTGLCEMRVYKQRDKKWAYGYNVGKSRGSGSGLETMRKAMQRCKLSVLSCAFSEIDVLLEIHNQVATLEDDR